MSEWGKKINVVAIVLPYRANCFFDGCIVMLTVSAERIDVPLSI